MYRHAHFLVVVVIVTFLTVEAVPADWPALQRPKTFGGSSYDFGRSFQQTTDGCYIITGGKQFKHWSEG